MEVEKPSGEGENPSLNEQNQGKTNDVCTNNEATARDVELKVKLGTTSLESESKLSDEGASSEAKEPESSHMHNHDLNGYRCESDFLTSESDSKVGDNVSVQNTEDRSSLNVEESNSGATETQSVNMNGASFSSDSDLNKKEKSDASPLRSLDCSPTSHGHGSHRSPDPETRAEYRKIKEEVTGEGETSESEGDDISDMPGLIDIEPKDKAKDTAEFSGNSSELSKPTEAVDDSEKKEKVNEWVDILGNGLLKKKVLKAGQGRDTRPDRGQIVMLRTAGRLDDGTAVDWKLNTQFILGEGEVIQALDLGVALMQVEEVCELVTDAKYAYGSAGRPDNDPPIPPNSRITYELELLCVREGPNIENMEDEERIQIADKKRELGNQMYSNGDYSGAINSYQRAIKYLDPSTSESVQEAKVKCFNNLAAAQLKIKAFPAALSSCARVLQLDPGNVKAVFRKGKVLAAQNELTEAIAFIKKASLLDPGNKTIRSELIRLRRQQSLELEKERSMYERMVGGNGKEKKKKTSSMMPWSLVIGATLVAVGGIVMALIFASKH